MLQPLVLGIFRKGTIRTNAFMLIPSFFLGELMELPYLHSPRVKGGGGVWHVAEQPRAQHAIPGVGRGDPGDSAGEPYEFMGCGYGLTKASTRTRLTNGFC